MARIRTIKPEFWEDETLAELPPPARLLFIATWNFADDAGVLKASPAWLKAKAFPYDEALRVSEVKKWCDSLIKIRMLVPIDYNNESYYLIRTFRKHQIIDKRHARFTIPLEVINEALSAYNKSIRTSHGEHVVSPAQKFEKEISSENFARDGPEKKIEEIKSGTSWIEGVAKSMKLSYELTYDNLCEFLHELKLKDDLQKSVREIKSHFINRMKINLGKEKISGKTEKENQLVKPRSNFLEE